MMEDDRAPSFAEASASAGKASADKTAGRSGNWIALGSIKQKGGKTVHAWAFEGDLPGSFQLRSNTFEIEWPPRSGNLKQFPEIDRAEFFGDEIARRKINPAQVALLDRLRAALGE